jgi:hypothetical protein
MSRMCVACIGLSYAVAYAIPYAAAELKDPKLYSGDLCTTGKLWEENESTEKLLLTQETTEGERQLVLDSNSSGHLVEHVRWLNDMYTGDWRKNYVTGWEQVGTSVCGASGEELQSGGDSDFGHRCDMTDCILYHSYRPITVYCDGENMDNIEITDDYIRTGGNPAQSCGTWNRLSDLLAYAATPRLVVTANRDSMSVSVLELGPESEEYRLCKKRCVVKCKCEF